MNPRNLTKQISLLAKVKSEPLEPTSLPKPQSDLPALLLDNYAFKQEKKLLVEKQEPTATSIGSCVKRLKWEPENWQEQYKRIKIMRSGSTAPVDACGCDAITAADPNIPEKIKRYHCLVSLMLSAQTKDQVTAAAMHNLCKLPLTVDTFISTETEILEKCIYPVSFYRRKVQAIKNTSKILKEKYDSDIPDNVNDLMKLPGVGPKMAYITMSSAWGNNVGIGVDTHVHRIANRLGWTKAPTKIPDKTRKELEDWLPSEYWKEVNHLLVGFGQQHCKPIGPKCSTCLCKEICPTGMKFTEVKKRVAKKIDRKKAVDNKS